MIQKVRFASIGIFKLSLELYKKARAGELRGFTGIDSEYEVPPSPDLVLHAGTETEAESIQRVLQFFYEKEILPEAVCFLHIVRI